MALGAGIGSLLSGLLGDITGNAQNKANIKNAANQTQAAGQTNWNAAMQIEQLLSNLTGGGHIAAPGTAQPGQGPAMGGGIMGVGGQFTTPQAGQGGQQLPAWLTSFLNQFAPGQGGGNPGVSKFLPPIPAGTGQMHNPLLPGTPGMAPAGPQMPATGSNPGPSTL